MRTAGSDSMAHGKELLLPPMLYPHPIPSLTFYLRQDRLASVILQLHGGGGKKILPAHAPACCNPLCCLPTSLPHLPCALLTASFLSSCLAHPSLLLTCPCPATSSLCCVQAFLSSCHCSCPTTTTLHTYSLSEPEMVLASCRMSCVMEASVWRCATTAQTHFKLTLARM